MNGHIDWIGAQKNSLWFGIHIQSYHRYVKCVTAKTLCVFKFEYLYKMRVWTERRETHTHNAHYEIETSADSGKMFCAQILYAQRHI